MPPREWRLRIEDMLDAIAAIRRFVQTTTFEQFVADDLVRSAVLYQLMIVGEAAGNIPTEVQNEAPDIPWRRIRGMRNVVAHVYFSADVVTVWNIVAQEIDPLVPQLQALLECDVELGR